MTKIKLAFTVSLSLAAAGCVIAFFSGWFGSEDSRDPAAQPAATRSEPVQHAGYESDNERRLDAVNRPAIAANGSEPPELFDFADDVSIARVTPWLDEYFARISKHYTVQGFEIVRIDELQILELTNGSLTNLRLSPERDVFIEVKIKGSREYQTGKFFNGEIVGESKKSSATFFVGHDGSVSGSVFLFGKRRYQIQSTPELPFHVVFYATGQVSFD